MVDDRVGIPVYFAIDANYISRYKPQIRALKSLRNGTASEHEQAVALDYILNILCNRFGNQFYPTERESCFAQGRKFVGDHIVGAINAPLTTEEA